MKRYTFAAVVLVFGCAAVPVAAAPLYFDFGPNGSGNTTPTTADFGHYNNITNHSAGSIASAVNARGGATGIGAYVTNAFRSTASGSTGGVVSSDAGFHENAQKDSFYVMSEVPTGTVQLRNLPSDLQYDFVLFSSRIATGVSDERIAKFSIAGEFAYLDSVGNTSNVATFSGVQPWYDASLDSYVVDIDVERKDGSSIGYLNALSVTPGGINYATPWGLYTQDFDSLASSPNDSTAPWADGLTLPGWYVARSDGSTFTSYRIFDGSAAKGNELLGLGSEDDPDRALGFQTYQTGGLDVHYGLRLVNNTDMTLNEFALSYKGEQWRRVSGQGVDSLLFDFQVFDAGEGDLTAGAGWTAVDSLCFDSPNNTGGSDGLDGNLPANSALLGATVRGFDWEPGQELWLRWTDIAAPFQALGIDDISFRAVPEPGGLVLLLVGGLVLQAFRRRPARRRPSA